MLLHAVQSLHFRNAETRPRGIVISEATRQAMAESELES